MSFTEEEIRNIIIIGGVTLGTVSAFIFFFIIQYHRKQLKHIKDTQILQSSFQQELLHTQIEIQEQTLKNISQEIHDNIGQALSLTKLNLNTMLPVSDEHLYEKIINSKALVSKAINDLRDLSRSLDTDYVKDMGLMRAIEYELEMMQKTGIIEASLVIEGDPIRFDKQKELILFRIIQETFHNIVKHAEAKILRLNVFYKPAALEILITDDGKGVDLTTLNEDGSNTFGLGIRNMYNRARLIGADLRMNSTLGKGTEVKIVLSTEIINHENKQ